jgi:uncharacterized protein (TIGR03067 family)
MRRLILPVVLLGLVAVVAADSPEKQLDRGDMKLLQGSWALQSVAGASETSGKDDYKDLRLTIKGNQIEAVYHGKTARATYRLDATQSPRKIDVTLTEGPEKLRGKTFEGIYLIEGPVFRVAFREPGKERPMNYPTGDQKGTYGLLFRKQSRP